MKHMLDEYRPSCVNQSRAASKASIEKAAAKIRNGEIVAFPTETIYGLGANALDEKAVRKIFKAKGRPSDNPMIVHISDISMLKIVAADVSDEARDLIERFWPGPFTLLFKKSSMISDTVTGGLPTVAVRMPANRIALDLIRASGVPIAAPSANKSGRPSPTSAKHVREDFKDIMILDGGETEHGLESTVVSLFGNPKILRLGAITVEQIKTALPNVIVAKKGDKAQSPGMKYRHYAPRHPLIIFNMIDDLISYAKKHAGCVVLCKTGQKILFKGVNTFDIGEDENEAAKNIYDALRSAKGKELLILAFEKRGIGKTIMDRLERAATKII